LGLTEYDTTGAFEYTDSSAYLGAKIKFGRFLTDWKIAKFQLPRPEPISFIVLNEKKQDILKNLSPSTIKAIDSIAKIKIAIEKNATYDSTGHIRIIDPSKKGLLNYLDSIVDKKNKKECMTITCLNPRDTLSQKLHEVKTYFLIESLGDTLADFDIRSSCGCEHPVWKKEMKVFPGHPDTVIIVSLLKANRGKWLKSTTISVNNCTQTFYTGPWLITE
jgi:hypothetical protein